MRATGLRWAGENAAGAPGAADAGDAIVELCAFRVGAEEYVIDLRRIREVVTPLEIRPVPRAPEFIDGVIDLRGEVLAVVDVRRRLGVPPSPERRKAKFLIALLGGRSLALVVDAVSEVVRIPRSSIRPTPGIARHDAPRFFLGVCGAGGADPARRGRGPRLRLLLNVRALLEPIGPEEISVARALAEGGGGTT